MIPNRPVKGLLLNVGYASFSAELMELERVMARQDALGGTGELNHAVLAADVGIVIGVGESGASLVFDEITVEIYIVRGEDELRIPGHAKVL